MSQDDALQVHPLREQDLEEVVQIARVVTGDENEGFWRGLLRAYLMGEGDLPEALSPSLCQVAVAGGRVVGFMIGDVQSWQFGIPRHGRIVTIGVLPDHRRSGVASQLAGSLRSTFKKMGLPFVHCMVRPGDPLGEFFRSIGFRISEFEVLEGSLQA